MADDSKGSEEEVRICISPDYKFPEVLQRTPRCLIALSGLDITNNAVHRLVWDEFSSGIKRADRKPILFKNIPANHIYPKCGENRTTYEDYALQGILKNSWLNKHCEELPSLVAFFFDLDWNDSQWEERQTECVSKVEVIRSALQNRASEIVLVLLQSSPPLPVGEASNISSERATALCAACELPRLNLFVLPFSQRPQGFIIKIEEAFYKKAIQYYSNKIHTVRAHKDMVANKQSLQLLFIRHNFKMAFFAEMKHDFATALKYYRTAYTHLLENMYLSDDRAMEFKMVSGFMNYKLCRLLFESNEPREAINQFRTHIDKFSKEMGLKQLVFEHYEWLSRQFSAFADLFSEAVRRGLKGLKTQNAGLYYYQAALWAIQRKKMSEEMVIDLHNTQLLKALPQVNYYGQRPWRKNLTDDKPSNMELRQMCIVTMQSNEKTVQHSWQIIPLLTQAISNLKSYKCERLITYLKILMADEYCLVKDYGRSYVLLNGIVEIYRAEQWWNNLTSVLLKLLRCTYWLGYIQEYVAIGLELISRYFPVDVLEKKRILQNITEVFSSSCPYPEPNLSGDEIQSANVAWAESWKKQDKDVAIQLSSLAGCVECKTSFMQQSYAADQQVKVQVFLRSSAPLSLKLRRLAITYTDRESFNASCVHDSEFILEPDVVKTFNFSFLPQPGFVGKTIEVHEVEAILHCGNGDDGCKSPLLLWNKGASDKFSSKPADLLWQKIVLRNKILILPRSSNVSVSLDHSHPPLIGEYYPISVKLTNQESEPITDVNIKFSLPVSLNTTQPAVEMFESLPSSPSSPFAIGADESSSLEVSCPELELDSGNSMSTKKIYLCCHAVGTRTMSVTVSYHIQCRVDGLEERVDCYCEKDHVENLEILKPFEMIYKVMSTKFRAAQSVSHNSPFLLMTELICKATCDLDITGSSLELNKGVIHVGDNFSQVEGLLMEPEDQATECFCLMSTTNVSEVLVGTYTVTWNRRHSTVPQDITSSVIIPPINAHKQICTLSADLPAFGEHMEVFQLSYTIHNLSQFIQEFETKLGPSDAFMYSGNRLSRFRVLPQSEHKIFFNLLPIVTGFTLLPSLELSYVKDGEKKPDILLSSNIPTSILIKPSSVQTNSSLNAFLNNTELMPLSYDNQPANTAILYSYC